MPVTVTFDLIRPTPVELNRLRGAFERLGWEHLGNTAYRYPRLGSGPEPPEDWFNHVLPALMLLRAFARQAEADGRGLRKFSLDTQSSTGFDPVAAVGAPPLAAAAVQLVQPSVAGQSFGRRRLLAWLDAITWPYAAPAVPPG
jgi:hypothetical protein